MTNNLNRYMLCGVILFFLSSNSFPGEAMMPPGPAAKEATEKTIKACEVKYMNVKSLRDKLFTGLDGKMKSELDEKIKMVKKPGIISLPKAKKDYEMKIQAVKREYEPKAQEIVFLKKSFDINFNEFTRFTNEKIKIRTAKTNRELKDLSDPYSSNCIRFAEGLIGFVDWALTGKGPKGFDVIYKDWVADAKKEK